MFRSLILSSAVALVISGPVAAQDMMANSGSMSSTEVGIAPVSGASATDYVKLAADSDMYEIQSSRLALTKSKREDVKALAQQMITEHAGTTKALMAALKNDDRTITRPSSQLSAANAAKIALLKKAPKAAFDDMYLQQQAEAHQTAWALHKGYAIEGTDLSLKQVASTAVPVIERHLQHVKQILPAALSPVS
ncbi:DUF4142 domain-containing protein [Phenylobacterium sp.]|jgi:putative membrane protein|uniref:DUF4142 domain-containing protein n=1 Tax=Phenylobacterium sp. TaxID=1871053 RepID=UPI002722289A|nr:DUF4142 domain-containing protein [Phenylobacterium sp.]MDO9433107.1 DUF4142 domain-containing protein [Phenylobacterium sp.]MDP1601142.1 DUF4142 domain-containing protein [Phenylobacterium sp.]MDP3594148.1 DUF4142 domain-containing protein [Phenylobacterium sp.]